MAQPIPIELPDGFGAFPFHVVNLGQDRELAHQILGPPQHVEAIDGLGDADYWACNFPCSLKLCFEFVHMGGYGNVYADLPEIAHAVRHLDFPKSSQTPRSFDDLSSEIDKYVSLGEPWRSALADLRTFQVWRHGDDGNAMPVGRPTSERDAKCWVAELESHGHKQYYWYSAI